MGMAAVHQMVERVSQLMEEKHGLGGRDLAAKLRRGRRLLPRKLRAAADRLAAADGWARNPRLRGRIDMERIVADYDACVRHLVALNPATRRRGRFASTVESVGIGILVLGLAVGGLLWWLGLL